MRYYHKVWLVMVFGWVANYMVRSGLSPVLIPIMDEFVSLLGPSGCGKTTLLRIMHGLVRPASGRILVDGKEVQGPETHRAMVFQDFGLLPWRTTLHSEAWQALSAAVAKNAGFPKIAIAVDEDIDPRDPDSVLWALSFRHQPHLDVKVIEGRMSALDPSSAPPTAHLREKEFPLGPTGPRGCSAMLIDATLKWPSLPTSLPKEEYMSHAKELWEGLGLPKLRPRKPWFGYSLGHWREEQEEEAELAIKGEYQRTWEKLAQQGEPI